MRRGNFRKDGLRSNAIEPVVDGNFFDGERARIHCREKQLARLDQGSFLEIPFAGHDLRKSSVASLGSGVRKL